MRKRLDEDDVAFMLLLGGTTLFSLAVLAGLALA